MIEIHPASMLALFFLLHFVADYTLQGCLANLKQKKWWDDQIEKKMPISWSIYKYDYKCGLACHGLYWSLVVCLPLLSTGGAEYAVNALIHGIVHALIDHAKANKNKINLIEDQMLHAAQIFFIWAVWL